MGSILSECGPGLCEFWNVAALEVVSYNPTLGSAVITDLMSLRIPILRGPKSATDSTCGETYFHQGAVP